MQHVWEQMIHQVISLFHLAERRLRTPELIEQYQGYRGWWRDAEHQVDGREGVYLIPEETAVSQALLETMRSIKDEYLLGDEESALGFELGDLDRLEFSLEDNRAERRTIGRFARPTDFRFYFRETGGMDLRIEAKTLLVGGDINSAYLSDRGINRFSDPEEPYTTDLIGGMVAYTVSENRVHWRAKVQERLQSNFEHDLPEPVGSILFNNVAYKNKKETRDEVLVFHFVLEFDADPRARDEV